MCEFVTCLYCKCTTALNGCRCPNCDIDVDIPSDEPEEEDDGNRGKQ